MYYQFNYLYLHNKRIIIIHIIMHSVQDRQEGGQLGQFALDPTLLGAPYSPMSFLSCSFQP